MSTYSATCCGLLVFYVFCTLKLAVGEQSSLYTEEICSLSELPMDKLIQIRSSLASENDIEEDNEYESIDVSSRGLPLAFPMASSLSSKPIRRYEEHDEKGKDTKISKIFQLAITALSFLAFGGYLLTLIIMAIRRNQDNSGNGNVIVFSVVSLIIKFLNQLKRFPEWIFLTSTNDNLQSLQKLVRPKRNILIFDPMENNFESEKLYEGMIMLSRSYALYS